MVTGKKERPMNYGTKAISLGRADPQTVANVILGLYGFAAALMMSIHLAGSG